MADNIDIDVGRAKQVVRGKVRKELQRYINQGRMIGRKGKDLVVIPVPQIDLPRFRFGDNRGGAGQGDGEIGDPIGRGQDDEGSGDGQAGDQLGNHFWEEFTVEELAEMMGEELELPWLVNKNKQQIVSQRLRYRGIYDIGPENLCVPRRTILQALKRSVLFIDPELFDDPLFNPADHVCIIPPDKRYRYATIENEYSASAVIIYIMDVSGSMTDEQKEIARSIAGWIDIWLRSQYKGTQCRYVIHDASAKEVDQNTFYHTMESGGTKISTAYQLSADIISPNSGYQSPYGGTYSPEEWNIYCIQFTDGDNWGDDNNACLEILKTRLLPVINLFGYVQIHSPYGSGEFIKHVNSLRKEFENLVTTEVEGREQIFKSIKAILGKGK